MQCNLPYTAAPPTEITGSHTPQPNLKLILGLFMIRPDPTATGNN